VSRQQIDLILIEEISKKSVANYTQWKRSRYKVAFEFSPTDLQILLRNLNFRQTSLEIVAA